jgi:multiple sugar transport system permease protein
MKTNKTAQGALTSLRGMRDINILRLFILPTIVLLVVINIFPLFWSAFLSFTRFSVYEGGSPIWIGIDNYVEILSERYYWRQFTTTALYVIIVVTVELIIGFLLAFLLNQKFKAKSVYITMLAVPMMMSPALVGALWKLIYNPNWGILNWGLGLGELDWISDPKVNIFGVMIVDVWMWTPFMMLLSVAGLSAIPQYLYEAAEIDRASPWFKFTHITLPLCAPLLLIAVLFRSIEAFKTFDIAMGITGVGATSPQLLSLRLYEKAFYRWDTGLSCAIAYVLLFIVIGVSSIFIRYLTKLRQ